MDPYLDPDVDPYMDPYMDHMDPHRAPTWTPKRTPIRHMDPHTIPHMDPYVDPYIHGLACLLAEKRLAKLALCDFDIVLLVCSQRKGSRSSHSVTLTLSRLSASREKAREDLALYDLVRIPDTYLST